MRINNVNKKVIKMKTSPSNRQSLDYREIFELIKSKGDKGVLQSDLWRIMGASSREGSRVAFKLMKAGLVRREKKLHKGKWTFVLISNKLPVQINSIIEQPCAFCVMQEKCGEPKYITPSSCVKLTDYLLNVVNN